MRGLAFYFELNCFTTAPVVSEGINSLILLRL